MLIDIYLGMGNRFKDLPEYHTLIKGHGVLAAITFLVIVPLAIFTARFWWRDPRLALRIHIWLQILTVLLSTVILVLGWFAVGPERSLTNPHHGIGIAIYVLILFQAIWGWLVRRLEKGRVIWRVSVKLMVRVVIILRGSTTNEELVTPMDWSSNSSLSHCTGPIGTDPLWITQGTFHTLRTMDVFPPVCLFCLFTSLPVWWWR